MSERRQEDGVEEKRAEETDESLNEHVMDGDLERENGQRKVKHVHDPKLPSSEEVRQHNLTHVPYRSWCPHCVRGRGKEMDHKRRKGEDEQGIPEYHLDYCFPGDEDGQRLTVLVVVERHTKMKKSVVVPQKGSTGRYAARMVMDLIDECGDKNRPIIVKTDQEPAIKFLVEDIRTARTGAQTIVEEAPKKSKGSNGVVERAVQTMEQLLRTLKSAFDERMGVRIDAKHPVLTWMCEYSGYLVNRLEVSADGKTAYERCKGKQAQVMGLEFGEKVLWKYAVSCQKMEKINARWGYGLFVGVRTKSNEIIVIDRETGSVRTVRTVRRVPEEERWSPDNLQWVQAVPWNHGKDDGEADGEMPEFDVKAGPGRRLTPGEVDEVATRDKDGPRIVHRAHLKKADFEKHGFTDRCSGCSALIRGLRIQPHAEHCRKRMEKILEVDLRVKYARARLEERGRKLREERHEPDSEVDQKRRKLEGIEEAAMKEEDPKELAKLFEEYRKVYQEREREKDESDNKRRKLQEIEDETLQTENPKRAAELYDEYMNEYKRQKRDKETSGEASFEEVASGSGDSPMLEERRMEIDQVLNDLWVECERAKEEEIAEYAWDDVNDIPLPIDKVRAARREEMSYMKGRKFEVVKKSEAYRLTGKGPISTKWVDTDKSHGTGEVLVRSRWVARDFKKRGEKDREDLFSATPPLEFLRYVISRQATRRADGRERKTMYIDVKKAHLAARCMEDVFVELPEEAGVEDDECGKLIYWLYGCRQAAQAWEEHYAGVLQAVGFKRLVSSPVAFYHPERDLVVVVHGDDFVFVGVDEQLDWVLGVLEKEYELKNRGRLGSGECDAKEIDMLGRVIRWHEWGLSWSGDGRHKAMMMDYFGMDGSTKTLLKNGYKDELKDKHEGEQRDLAAEECKAYRMLAARLNYVAQDCPPIQFAAKEICRRMAAPTERDFMAIKRLTRFMAGLSSVEWEFPWQSECEAATVRVFTDSDWAGCTETRRSTSGGLILVGQHPLRAWSSTQSTVATSSAEAELYSMAEGAARGLGVQSLLQELQCSTELVLGTDSAAAKAFASTRGLGRMRHIDVKNLWIQGLVRLGRVVLQKVRGDQNAADVLTKFLDRATCISSLARVGVRVVPAECHVRAEGGC